ncbi:MAG TPA: hypothetical protein VFT75_18320 [Nocardioidaceae bacterium]|nr:hypothetical protein [Nocardioidaceae bacterium]
MTTKVWAHVNDQGVCDNIAVFDENTPMEYFPGYIDVDALVPRPGIGWHYENDTWYAPPNPTLTAVPATVPNDGATVSTVTYTWQGWPEDTPPATADFIVNDGAPRSVDMTGDNATLDVTSADADTEGQITVQCAGLTVIVTVEAS